MNTRTAAALHPPDRRSLGYALGLLGVCIFALTLPMTRLATGSSEAPQFSPAFVTVARAALAGTLSVLFLLARRAPWPPRSAWGPLLLALLGNAIGFPLLLALALRHVPAAHAAVFMALLPLTTAAAAAWLLGQRARAGFWWCSGAGAALVLLFALLRAQHSGAGLGLHWADLLLLGCVLCGAMGYIAGAKVTPALGAEQVICWVCVLALPLSLPATWWLWSTQPGAVAPSAWGALAYVGVFSMWAGFFAWYRGLAIGGALRVSQIQLLQPFISLLGAAWLLGEVLDATTVAFALAVVATVFYAKRLA
ncbi:MAG: DMT family transporter [Rhodoferax sp.]